MTTQIAINRIQEIRERHAKIGAYLRNTLEEAIRIGELLTAQKADLKHGEWLKWLKGNVPFSQKTAFRYMQLYHRKDELKLVTVTNLQQAYKLLAAPETEITPKPKKAAKQKRKPTAKVDTKTLQEIVQLFRRLYQGATGKKPYIGGPQYGILKSLLNQQTVEDIEARLYLYFAGDFWFTKSGFSLKDFMAHYNEIAKLPHYSPSIGRSRIESEDAYRAATALHYRLLQRVDESQEFRDLLAIRKVMLDYRRAQQKEWEPPIARHKDGSPVELAKLKYCMLCFEDSLYVYDDCLSWLEEACNFGPIYDVIAELRMGGEWAKRLFAWMREQDAFASMVRDSLGDLESPGVVKTMVENRIVTNTQADEFNIETFLTAWDKLQNQWREEEEAAKAVEAQKHAEGALAVRKC